MESHRSISNIIEKSRNGKKAIWSEIYSSVKKAILNGESAALILEYSYKSPENSNESKTGGFTLEKEQFSTFLNNYLIWSEVEELYEDCSEIKKTIDLLHSSYSKVNQQSK